MNELQEQSSGQFNVSDTGKILLVEDNLVNTEVAVDMLEVLGFTVDIANNGQEALNIYDKHQHILILMDCEMPVMTGYDATRQIRKDESEQQHAPTPIIALTAHAISGVREKCIASGMNDFLSKPFSMPDLQSMLNKWLATGPAELSDHQVVYSDSVEGNNTSRNDNNESTVLDYEVLNKLGKNQKKNNLVSRVVGVYLEQSCQLLEELMEAARSSDVETVRRISHTLKSSSVNVGAIGLSELCRELELICEQGQIKDSLVQQIHRTFSDVKEALNEVLGDINN